MAKLKQSIRYGVGSASSYNEDEPYSCTLHITQEAVAVLREYTASHPGTSFRIFKLESTGVVTDVTAELALTQ